MHHRPSHHGCYLSQSFSTSWFVCHTRTEIWSLWPDRLTLQILLMFIIFGIRSVQEKCSCRAGKVLWQTHCYFRSWLVYHNAKDTGMDAADVIHMNRSDGSVLSHQPGLARRKSQGTKLHWTTSGKWATFQKDPKAVLRQGYLVHQHL